jgi:hypothetical protein
MHDMGGGGWRKVQKRDQLTSEVSYLKMDPLNGVSRNEVVYKNLTVTLKVDFPHRGSNG